ncbi:MAG: hypothetical protein E6Q06_02005 [Candidatus Moraniibacteriota bacterium]|nr:MAG: hypothetical protein E6Q06_02005 [Candidatus Moranbacteria bacterium]
MFTFDDKFIYTWELRDGQLLRPLRLTIFELTGQIISRPLRNFHFFNHSAIILGYDATSYLEPVYVCYKTLAGYEIAKWPGSGSDIKMTIDPRISRGRCLARLEQFFNSRRHRYNLPAYNLTISNCQNFSHAMVYGGDIHLALTAAAFIFLIAFFTS